MLRKLLLKFFHWYTGPAPMYGWSDEALKRYGGKAILAAFLALHALDGSSIWLAPSQVVSVRSPLPGEYPSNCNSVVLVSGPAIYCVTDKPADVVSKLEQSK